MLNIDLVMIVEMPHIMDRVLEVFRASGDAHVLAYLFCSSVVNRENNTLK